MLTRTIRAVWAEPPAPGATGPRSRDAVLVALVLVIAPIETLLRSDVVWPVPSLAVAIVGGLLLPFRRVHPLLTTAVAIGSASVGHLVALVREVEWDGLGTAIVFLLLPYSLGRWGSGRQMLGGAAVFAVPLTLTALGGGPAGDVVGGIVIVLLAGAVGAGVRYRAISHRQQLDGIRSRERAELARELHDTVAHHVSTIAVQANVGRTFVETDTAATAEALGVIADQASRTLEEMRTIVSALRDGDVAELSPQYGVCDIAALAGANGPGPPVTVELHGRLDDLRPSVSAALYRLAREAITNARRHAHHATGITVVLAGDDEQVRLAVDDDGRGGGERSTSGYGVVGMSERAKLLGGTFSAGPRADGGWNVTALLPRQAPTR